PDEGFVSTDTDVPVEATPHPSEVVASEFVADAGAALSHQGRGHNNAHRERESGGEMPINYEQLMALKNLGQKYAYGDREVMLYAYGIGMGADPMDEKELAFVNEAVLEQRPLKVVPTFASVAAW